MRLPIPIFLENTYQDVEVEKPTAGCLADTRKILDSSGNYFLAMKTFLSGCVLSIGDIDDPLRVKSMLMRMPEKSAEYLAQATMVDFYGGDDYVEGVYPCILCGHKIISQLKNYDGAEVDTRDRISDLKIHYKEDDVPEIYIEL